MKRTSSAALAHRPSPKRPAVLYARVSSREQEQEGFSIPSQLKLLRRYAEQTDLTIVREFVDVETAKKTGRAGFGEMVAFFGRTPACRVLLTEKTDRLYRNARDWVTLDELEVQTHFIKENFIYSQQSRSSEKFMHGIKVLMAKNFIDNLSEETRKGQKEKAAQGLWPSYAPLGYTNVTGPDGRRIIELDPVRAPLVTRLFERYATGHYSLKALTALADDDGLRSRKGRRLSKATIHHILSTRTYTGDFDWDGTRYRGTHPPLVSPDLWEHVQDVLHGRGHARTRRAKHNFAFSRLITCGHCGCALVGERKKDRYTYYHCTGYRGKCPEPYTREEVLEEGFATLLQGLSFDAAVMDWVADALCRTHADDQAYNEDAIKRLQADHARIAGRIEDMYLDKLDGRVEADFYDRKAAEWRRELDRLGAAIDERQATARSYLPEGVRLLELARRAPELFETQEPREKRRLLNFLLSNCSWKDGTLHAEFRQPFDMLAITATASRTDDACPGGIDAISKDWLLRRDSNLQPSG